LCQEQQIVPVVEPEVLMDGDHSIERCEAVTNETLQVVFDQLHKQRVYLEGMILKPNMVISGKKAANRAAPEQVAQATVRCLRRHVPCAVPGIAFLSGGQASQEATLHLSLMNQISGLPWSLTFSYGRALQDAALKGWGGTAAGYAVGQREYLKRARLNSLATTGRYTADMENKAA
jgi:fructose-bisphosphate aldolase, class I